MTSSASTSSWSKIFASQMFVGIVCVVLGAALATFGQFAMNRYTESHQRAVVSISEQTVSVKDYPESVRSQVLLVPYELEVRHAGGRSAENVTISLRSSEELPKTRVRLSSGTEQPEIRQIDPRSVAIDLVTLRPRSVVTIAIALAGKEMIEMTSTGNDVEFVDSKQATRSPLASRWELLWVVPSLIFLIIAPLWWIHDRFGLWLGQAVSVFTDDRPVPQDFVNKFAVGLLFVAVWNTISSIQFLGLGLPKIPVADVALVLIACVLMLAFRAKLRRQIEPPAPVPDAGVKP